MLANHFTAVMLSFLCFLANAQNNQNSNNTSSLSNKKAIESNASTISEEKRAEIQKQITQIDSHINAILTKREYILNDPEQTAIAQEEGWFEKMDATMERLNAKKAELQQQLN